jgi:hypothetical protein
MSLRVVALDVLAVSVLLSLLCIVLFILLAAATSLMTLAHARRQLRQHGCQTGRFPGLSDSQDLADINEALERVMNEEGGVLAKSF